MRTARAHAATTSAAKPHPRKESKVSTPASCAAGVIRTLAQSETALPSCRRATIGSQRPVSGSQAAKSGTSRWVFTGVMAHDCPRGCGDGERKSVRRADPLPFDRHVGLQERSVAPGVPWRLPQVRADGFLATQLLDPVGDRRRQIIAKAPTCRRWRPREEETRSANTGTFVCERDAAFLVVAKQAAHAGAHELRRAGRGHVDSVPVISSGRTHWSYCSAVRWPLATAASRRVMPSRWAVLAMVAALS